MSIDARVQQVVLNDDGSGKLVLVDRPARPGDTPGIAGQSVLSFSYAPLGVVALKGCDVWGGDSFLMLGEREIARREGYTHIAFSDLADQTKFEEAVLEYHRRRRPAAVPGRPAEAIALSGRIGP